MITIAGAGLAGLASALELARAGAQVRVFEAGSEIGLNSVSRFAGGMLAPWCERESAEEDVITLGASAADWWDGITPVTRRGTLVVAPPRDQAEVMRFARRTSGHCPVDGVRIAELEPALKGRFSRGLFFEQEAHLNPRIALQDLAQAARDLGVEVLLNAEAPEQIDLDCRGIRAPMAELRPVRGEMAILESPDISITRTVRLLHPRMPVYLVPRGHSVYMIGATMVESSSERPVTLRSLSELLGAAYAIHPGFAEASVIEIGSGLRPAFPDNLPRLVRRGATLHLNGLFRHGFLLAPAMATRVVQHFIPEISHEHHSERQSA